MTIAEVSARFDNPMLVPHGVINTGKLYITFIPFDEVSHSEYVIELYRLYFMANEYRGKKPIVMVDLSRGTYTSRQVVIEAVRQRIKRMMSGPEITGLFGEMIV